MMITCKCTFSPEGNEIKGGRELGVLGGSVSFMGETREMVLVVLFEIGELMVDLDSEGIHCPMHVPSRFTHFLQ